MSGSNRKNRSEKDTIPNKITKKVLDGLGNLLSLDTQYNPTVRTDVKTDGMQIIN